LGNLKTALGFNYSITNLPNYSISLGLLNFPASQARRAHADPLAAALNLGVDRAQIDVPAPLGHVVGVADVISKLRPLAADFTYLCHECSELMRFPGILILLDFSEFGQ
jgi:hypothetical protein